MSRVEIIGLTGGIGAGKSVVARVLRTKGIPVYDCDLRAKSIMEESEEIICKLKDRFGEECYHPAGNLNRKLLADRIFSSDEERKWLNALVHAAVKEDIISWRDQNSEASVIFVESAILHTSRLDEICSRIWLVEAPEDIRFQRAMDRGGISAENLKARMETQKKEFDSLPAEKLDRIDNSGRFSVLSQIDSLCRQY